MHSVEMVLVCLALLLAVVELFRSHFEDLAAWAVGFLALAAILALLS